MTTEVAQDEKAKLPNISDDLVVTKYKMASEIVNRKSSRSPNKGERKKEHAAFGTKSLK